MNSSFWTRRQLILKIPWPFLILYQDPAIFWSVIAQKPWNLEGLEIPIIRILRTEEFFSNCLDTWIITHWRHLGQKKSATLLKILQNWCVNFGVTHIFTMTTFPFFKKRNQYFWLRSQLKLEIVWHLMVLHQDWAIFWSFTAQKPWNLEGLEMPTVRIFRMEEFFFKSPGHLIWHLLKIF